NAVTVCPQTGAVQVCVSHEAGGWIRIEVEDTGVGIPAENLPHIFDRFYRVRNPQTNSIQGLGLGLSFVSWIAKAHGGYVSVASEVGKGTRFVVRLPSEPVTSASAPEQSFTTAQSR